MKCVIMLYDSPDNGYSEQSWYPISIEEKYEDALTFVVGFSFDMETLVKEFRQIDKDEDDEELLLDVASLRIDKLWNTVTKNTPYDGGLYGHCETKQEISDLFEIVEIKEKQNEG